METHHNLAPQCGRSARDGDLERQEFGPQPRKQVADFVSCTLRAGCQHGLSHNNCTGARKFCILLNDEKRKKRMGEFMYVGELRRVSCMP